MKNILPILILLIALLVSSCRKEDQFLLSRDEILEEAVKDGGEVVKVVGDSGPFKYAWTFHGNYATSAEEANGSGGVSRAGHSMTFNIEAEFFHRIHIYDNAAGGALLVGVKHSVESQAEQKSGEQNTAPNP